MLGSKDPIIFTHPARISGTKVTVFTLSFLQIIVGEKASHYIIYYVSQLRNNTMESLCRSL